MTDQEKMDFQQNKDCSKAFAIAIAIASEDLS